MKTNIAKYWELLCGENLFAAVILEEMYDLDENGTPCADCTNWAQDYRAELARLISKIESGNGMADRAEDYRHALSILDEMESKLLKALHPDVYAECSTRTSYKRFSVV